MGAVSPEAKANARESSRNYMRRKRAAQKAGLLPPDAPLTEAQKAQRRQREKVRLSDEEKRTKRTEQHRKWRAKNRDSYNEKRRARRAQLKATNPDKLRWENRNGYAAGRRFSHGRDFFEMFNEMWAQQDGTCYLCREPLPPLPKTHVDHDHACCPKGKSCAFCRRGLACDRCNKLVGQAGDNPELLRRIADNFEPVLKRTKARLSERPAQGTLWGEAA